MNAQYSLPGYDHPIIRWLLGEGRRITESMSFLGAFAEQLRGSGIEVDRAAIGVPILHPQVYSFSGIWEPGKGALERRNLRTPIRFRDWHTAP
jgi:adenylate cyclase